MANRVYKQTAKKSTGGTTKRVRLIVVGKSDWVLRSSTRSASRSSSAAVTPPPPSVSTTPPPANDIDVVMEEGIKDVDYVSCTLFLCGHSVSEFCQWCALCSDGHDILVVCNRCGSANCASCVPQLQKVSPEDLRTHSYLCVGCTKRGELFQVCPHSLPSCTRALTN